MFIVVPNINSTGLAIVAEAELRFGEFSSEKSCRHKLVVFVFILDGIFCGTSFFIFQDSVWLVKKS